MKLNGDTLKELDNEQLLIDCCTVKQIQNMLHADICKKNGDNENYEKLRNTAKKFEELAALIDVTENLSYEYLKNSFQDESIQKFLNCMEKYRKHTIQSSYKKQAVKAYERYNQTKDISEIEGKLKGRFFCSHSNLKGRTTRSHLKVAVGGLAIVTLLATGALTMNHPSNSTIQDPIKFEEKQINGTTPDSILDNSSSNIAFHQNLENDFLQHYADAYNQANNANQSTDNLALDFSNQDYILKINNARKVCYVSHGNFPNNIENYLKNKDISFERMGNCKSASIYASKLSGDLKEDVDEFGNSSKVKIDSVAWIKNEETGDIECVKLFDGNNPTKDGLLDSKASTVTPLVALNEPLEVLSNTVGTSEDIIKTNYENAIKRYQENNASKALNNCMIENQIGEEIREEELER